MKKNKLMPRFILACALMLGLVLSSAPLWAEAADVSAEVASVRGTVSVKRAASEKTFSAFVGLKLKQGDVVTVAAGGEVVINIGADKTVKGLSDSSFKISNLTGTDADSQAGFTLIKGTVFNEVRSPQSSNEGLTVRTGNTVAGVRGTTYTVSLRATDGFTVRTLEGSVFLDTVLARVEADTNASLVTEQQTVGAGEGAGTGREGTYELSMEDFTRAELEYITQHPEDFPQDMVSEAQKLLDDWVDTTPAPTEEQKQIVYEDIPATESSGGGGDGGGSTSVAYYTVNFVNSTANGNFSEFHTPTGSIQVAAGSQLPAGVPHAGRLGYRFDGWYTDDTGSNFTSPPLTGALRYEPDNSPPINSNLTLYPYFVLDSSSFGDGTSGNPYIVNGDNFPHFSQYVHTATGLAAHYKLAGNIFCDDYDGSYGSWALGYWRPIGYDTNPFSGGFDGDGYEISGLNCGIEVGGTNQYSGFFGSTNGGTVENLTIEGRINVTGATSTIMAGGIVGYANNGTIITNCYNKVAINISTNSGAIYAGGIAGMSAGGGGAGEHTEISQCRNSVSVSGTSNGTIIYAGGIMGATEGLAANTTIEYCANTGAVSANDGNAYAGGIAGRTQCNIEQSSNTGSITANSSTGIANAGGIVGIIIQGDIRNCFSANGSVTATAGTTAYAGGIAGILPSPYEIADCYVNNVIVTTNYTATASEAGGIVGQSNGNTTYCVAYSGNVNGTLAARIANGGTLNDNYANENFSVNSSILSPFDSGATTTALHGGHVTLADMQLQTWWGDSPPTGLGWEFSSTWQWSGSGPPTLQGMP